MLKERLQILVTAEQRRLLEAEAVRARTSVAALIRAAIDARYGSITREDRQRAVEEIAAMHGRYADPAELNRLVEEERDDVGRRLGLGDPR